ncbi:MAG TPA: 3-oxoacyl-[acyl-carrier-protein] synthase III C-terminal domain-containing protein [Bacillales bacterium]|nr:3-oxoacyl-[acyl-carrier-protein] synthase III C-terminal domain-containing protein [Bacillales bacterium]
MTQILSVGTSSPPYRVAQDDAMELARGLFQESFPDINRMLGVFHNGQIESRYLSVPLEWFQRSHSLREKNDLYIEISVQLGMEAIRACLDESRFMSHPVSCDKIDAIFFVSTTGFSTPSIEAKIMNQLPFSPHTKRVPIWGLGCAGGAAGLSRAHEYCLAYPGANVLVISEELCSLTFQSNDLSKSNLIGTSLFADGAACVLLAGDQSELLSDSKLEFRPLIRGTQSTLMPHSEDVMGWDVKDNGLYVIFSKSIPSIIEKWLKPNVEEFLASHRIGNEHIAHFIAHPGGKKVLEAYEKSLGISERLMNPSRKILNQYGNMSSPTVLFVLKEHMEQSIPEGEYGLAAALGPGFSSELLLLQWTA